MDLFDEERAIDKLTRGDCISLQNAYATLQSDYPMMVQFAAVRRITLLEIYLECQAMIVKLGKRIEQIKKQTEQTEKAFGVDS